MQENTKVLVVGAGALGVTTAYHLRQSGADISFYVRPQRAEQLRKPLRLYAYHKLAVDELVDFDVITSPEELNDKRFHFILLTLDGAACRSAEGVQLLAALGYTLRGKSTALLVCGVGFGLLQHVKEHTGFSDDQLIEGTMTSFCYQVGREGTPEPEKSMRDTHDACDFAYLDFASGRNFMVAGPSKPAKAFVRLFNANPMVRCVYIPRNFFRSATASYVAFTTACELSGWNSLDHLIGDRALWALCCRAQREILGLKQYGLAGKLMVLLMTNSRYEKMMRQMELEAHTMGFFRFFHFHHGGKVREQNIEGLKNCIKAGEEQGRDMSASSALYERLRARPTIQDTHLSG
jgi:hypothetical protein